MAGRCSPCVGRGVDYEVRCLMPCILSRGTGIECCWVPSRCGLHWNEISGRLTKQVAIKRRCRKYHAITDYFCFVRFPQDLKRLCIKSLKNKETCDIFLLKVLSRSNMEALSKFTEHKILTECDVRL